MSESCVDYTNRVVKLRRKMRGVVLVFHSDRSLSQSICTGYVYDQFELETLAISHHARNTRIHPTQGARQIGQGGPALHSPLIPRSSAVS
jgi:hypothetical protein